VETGWTREEGSLRVVSGVTRQIPRSATSE